MKVLYKVSIIIPAYNVELYIEQCLLSAVQQTLTNIEVIAINDGSTDGTPNILQQYAEMYSSIKVLHQNNSGVSSARNLGIEHAKGKYIYFLDSDDYIEETAMEILYNKAEENDLDLVLLSGEAFHSNESINVHELYRLSRQHKYPYIKHGQKLFAELVNNEDYFGSCYLFLVKKSIILNNKLLFNNTITYVEDDLFTFKLFFNCEKVMVVPQILYHYRQDRPSSLITTYNNIKCFFGFYTAIKEMNQCYLSSHIQDEAVQNAYLKYIENLYSRVIALYNTQSPFEKKQQYAKLQELKNIAYNYKCFGNIKYWLFYFSENLYFFIKNLKVIFRH